MRVLNQSVLLLLLSFGVSFNAFAGYWTYYHQGATERFTTQAAALSYGKSNKFKDSYACYSLKSITNETSSYIQGYWIQYDKSCSSVRNSNAYFQLGTKYVSTDACSPGQELNDSTGKCETPPPTCGPNEQLNPDSLECEPVPFCDRDSTNDALFEAEQSCAAEGGLFSFQCSNGGPFDGPEGLTTKCTQPNECVLGYPNFPECLGDLDPTDPLPDSGGDFNGGSAGTSTPDAPSFDKTEPDAVTPNPETDTALLAAIQNLNRDNNQALVGLNTDLNKGLTNIDNQLSQLNETNNAIGQSIVDQINHDRALFEANKALALQQTGAINKAGADITGALDSGFGDIGNKLNELAAGSKTTPADAGCDTAFSCSGNAYECYMAKQAFETRCSSLEFAETDASGLQTELQPLGDALNVHMGEFNDSVSVDALKGDTLDVTNTMNTINESNGLNFDAGCPAPKNYDYGLGVFTIDYSPFCDLAVVIRALLMLAASIGSLMLYAKFL